MKTIISQEELEKLKRMKGETRAMGIKNNLEFILKEEGEEGLKRVEEIMASLGYPVNVKKIRVMDFYPLVLEGLLLEVIRKVFNYNDQKFQEMGKFGAKSSLIIRFFTKYFSSLEKVMEKAPQMWEKYFTAGIIAVKKYDQENKIAIITLRDFQLNPSHCQLLMGFLSALLKMMIKQEISYEETKCVFKGDDHHEFLLKW